MTTNWQRPRDEHGRFAKPAADLNGATCAGRQHEFELGPQMGLCRACGGGWADWQHAVHRPEPGPIVFDEVRAWAPDRRSWRSWWWGIDPKADHPLLVALPFVIALLGLGFSIAALIVGVQR